MGNGASIGASELVRELEQTLSEAQASGADDLQTWHRLQASYAALQAAAPSLDVYRQAPSPVARRSVAFAKGLDLSAREQPAPVEPKSEETQLLIKAALERTLFEPGKSEESSATINLMTVMDWMTSCDFEAGRKIITQGDKGDYFYVIESGRVRYTIGGQPVPHEGRGDGPGGYFGELALIYNVVRGATVEAAEDCHLWRLSRDHFREVQARASSNSFVQRCRWLQNVSLLAQLSNRQLSRVAGVLTPMTFEAGERIVTQGDVGDAFYLIERGEVVCKMRSVLRERVRRVRARLTAVATFIMMARKAGLYREKHGEETSIPKGSLLRRGSSKLAKGGGQVVPVASHAAAEEGKAAPEKKKERRRSSINLRRFSLTRSNAVQVAEDYGRPVATLGPGDYFGEAALLTNQPRNATVEAVGRVRVLALERSVFEELLGPLSDLLDFNASKRILRMLEGLDKLSDFDIEGAARLLEEVQLNAGDQIYKQGDVAHTLYLIKSGAVNCVREELRETEEWTLGPWMFVGERIFTNTPEEGTSRSVGSTRLMALSKSNCAMLINRAVSAHAVHQSTVHYPPLHLLEEVAQIGHGGFGRVSMVRMEHASGSVEALAVKKLNKAEVVRAGQEQHVLQEKEVLASLPPHPFVLRLLATSQDVTSLYMLTPLIRGGELFDIIHKKRGDNVLQQMENVIFYCANVFLALEHLHAHDIAYRDLKPENLLIGETGYLTLVDMGAAKRIPYTVGATDGAPEQTFVKSYTLCGTPEYLAPEFVLNVGHDHAVDLWALGILMFEMTFERTPFEEAGGDFTALFSRICLAQITFPEQFVQQYPAAANLMLQLLHKNPSRRLGMLKGGSADVRNHECFELLNWDDLMAERADAPYVPSFVHQFDDSCFTKNHPPPDEVAYEGEEDPNARPFEERLADANVLFEGF